MKIEKNYREAERCGNCKHSEILEVGSHKFKLICKLDGFFVNVNCTCDIWKKDDRVMGGN